jgi:hypothetical protein
VQHKFFTCHELRAERMWANQEMGAMQRDTPASARYRVWTLRKKSHRRISTIDQVIFTDIHMTNCVALDGK